MKIFGAPWWFTRRVTEDDAIRARLNRLAHTLATSSAALASDLDEAEVAVVDVESSGLDAHSDSLIAVGAVKVRGAAVLPGESFEVVLKQAVVSETSNILIHRIGHEAQCAGLPPAEALLDCMTFFGDRLLVGYHADFDRILIERAAMTHLGVTPMHRWLDLAMLAPALIREGEISREDWMRGARARPLDWWLERLDIRIAARHAASADALATAQLWSVLVQACKDAGIETLVGALKLAEDYRWMRATVNSS